MFDRDYELSGKYATYAKYLRDSIKVFKRHIDLYMIGAVIGFLHGRSREEDTSVQDSVRIFADVFIREKNRCEFIYRMLMLLEGMPAVSVNDRADRAFREDGDEVAVVANMEIFNSYVRGGIEYLYEVFNDNCTTQDDVLNKVFLLVDRFKCDMESKSDDEIIRSVMVNS